MLSWKTRVSRAAKKLDFQMPGWAKKIVLKKFSLVSTFDCILGQIYGHWLKAPRGFYKNQVFGIDHSTYMAEVPEIENCWKDEIKSRRKKGAK